MGNVILGGLMVLGSVLIGFFMGLAACSAANKKETEK